MASSRLRREQRPIRCKVRLRKIFGGWFRRTYVLHMYVINYPVSHAKMKFLATTLLGLFATVASAYALIELFSAPPGDNIDKKSYPGSFLVCTDSNYGGACQNFDNLQFDQCYVAIPEWKNVISSAEQDLRVVRCTLYTNLGCVNNGGQRVINWRGEPDLRTISIDDQTQNFKCVNV